MHKYPFRYGQRLVAGIVRYAAEHPHWEIVTPYFNTEAAQVIANAPKIDGILASIFDHKTLSNAALAGKPIVECSNTVYDAAVPQVFSDEAAIGRMAAQHLLEKGLVNFAYCGYAGHKYALERGDAYAQALERRGYGLVGNFQGPWECASGETFLIADLRRWLESLPRPVAVFCCTDYRALQLYQAARQAKLNVPGDIAILGVDNERDMLALYGMEISSIEQNVETVGWEAARLLDEMMHGAPRPTAPLLVSPLELIPRLSTDVSLASDPVVTRARELIRARALGNFNVKDLIHAIGISRRCLERRFQATVGTSPSDEIARVRLARARELLVNTNMTLSEVADALGFCEQRQLTRLFKAHLNITPLRFRTQNKGK
ncbi:MAG: DNA-binding transcriptional regulator [Verrucomicrobiota bacterium]|nr:DNA-binding transcriptional regulator [Verrucomicrobiota bacterium]